MITNGFVSNFCQYQDYIFWHFFHGMHRTSPCLVIKSNKKF